MLHTTQTYPIPSQIQILCKMPLLPFRHLQHCTCYHFVSFHQLDFIQFTKILWNLLVEYICKLFYTSKPNRTLHTMISMFQTEPHTQEHCQRHLSTNNCTCSQTQDGIRHLLEDLFKRHRIQTITKLCFPLSSRCKCLSTIFAFMKSEEGIVPIKVPPERNDLVTLVNNVRTFSSLSKE